MTLISITSTISLDESELHEEFIRASGPGGQNVNKVATAVQLRFDVLHSPALRDDVRLRLIHLARNRINERGELIITAQRFRTQEQNRTDARARLSALIQQAAIAPTIRRTTKPTRAAKARRIENKKHRGKVKAMRRVASDE